jgi:GDPmannose 4,6-dehydratase
VFGLCIKKTKVDKLILDGTLEFQPSDMGIVVYSDPGKITIEFDKDKFRPADVPMLLSSTAKIQQLGFQTKYSLRDIINDQLNYFLGPSR